MKAQGSEEVAGPKTQVDRQVLTAITVGALNASAQHRAQPSPSKKCINAQTAQGVTFIAPATVPTAVTSSDTYSHHCFI